MSLAPPPLQPPPPRFRLRLRGHLWLVAMLGCCLLAVAAGVAAASLLQRDLPQIAALEDYRPPVVSRILAADGVLLRQLGEQRRIRVRLADLPESFRQAVVAIEDADFYRHPGVDLSAMLRAVWRDLVARRKAQGASTITQQLARNLFLTFEKKWTRKVQEWILALHIEKSYTKDEILELYCNLVLFGHGRYGVEAASRFYFGKPASALTLEESALLAGLLQRPEEYSPFRSPERAKRRRDVVLSRMVAEGYLTPAQAEAATSRPVVVTTVREGEADAGAYFVEAVRQDLVQRFGEETLYRSGLEVTTTLIPTLQRLAEAALRDGLRALDRRRGFRPVTENVLAGEGVDPESWDDPSWDAPPAAGDVVRGVVVSVTASSAMVRIGEVAGRLSPAGAAWTGRANLIRLLHRGDVTLFRVEEISTDAKTARLSLDQEPQVEGAVILLDPASGEILAMVGGYDFRRSQFNRALQARRQAGSAFKPVVYAAALEAGVAPSDLLLDTPVVFVDPDTHVPYQPENYERDYWGLITVRTALEHSRNIPAVRLINIIGYAPVIDVARRLGIRARLKPYPSLALGATEVTLLELTSAYAAIANGGLRVDPYLLRRITSAEGQEHALPPHRAEEALDPAVVHVLTRLLEGVARTGTAATLADFGRPVAVKTGTTDEYSDAWLIGFTPHLACGVWVGLDQVQTLGPGMSGARAALPIWSEIMREAVKTVPPDDFSRPAGVSQLPIDPDTGLRASLETRCPRVFLESFRDGTEPRALCGAAPHFRRTLPYFLQELPLDADLRLLLTPDELQTLLEREEGRVALGPLPGRLEVHFQGRDWSLDFTESPAVAGRPPVEGRLLAPETSPAPGGGPTPSPAAVDSRRSLDGRRPELAVLRTER